MRLQQRDRDRPVRHYDQSDHTPGVTHIPYSDRNRTSRDEDCHTRNIPHPYKHHHQQPCQRPYWTAGPSR